VVEVRRLVTVVELDDRTPSGRSASAHLYAELVGGRRLLLLDDRGWASSAPIAAIGRRDVEDTARTVVGPDEPAPGHTQEQAEAGYWQFLKRRLRRSGIDVGEEQLRGVPHGVEIGEHLNAQLEKISS
jgi:ADP-ribose pyrophosphatase YjhB (NUDIX family)